MVFTLDGDPRRDGVRGQISTGGGAQSWCMVFEGVLCWFKGPMDKVSATALCGISGVLDLLPGNFTMGRLCSYGTEFYVMYENLAHVPASLRLDSGVPRTVAMWGDGKSQEVLDTDEISTLGAELWFTNNYKHMSRVGEQPDALLWSYLLTVLSRTVAGVGDNAPRNCWFDLRGMQDEFRPADWIATLDDHGASLLVSGDFDKKCDAFADPRGLWEVAVCKKHGKAVVAALRSLLLRTAPELLYEYGLVDPARLPPDAQRRLEILLELLRAPEGVFGEVTAVAPAMVQTTLPFGPATAPVDRAVAAAPVDSASPSPSIEPTELLGLIPRFSAARPTTTVTAGLPDGVIEAMDRVIAEKLGPGVSPAPQTLTTGMLLSSMQKVFRSGTNVRENLTMVYWLLRDALRLMEDHAALTGKTTAWQAFQTFAMGRIAVMLAEDAATDPEAIGATVSLFRRIEAQWSTNKPKTQVIEWLKKRDKVLRNAVRWMISIGSGDRMRPASVGSASGIWPKAPKGAAQMQQEKDRTYGPTAPVDDSVPEPIRSILGRYNPSFKYRNNVSMAFARLRGYICDEFKRGRITEDRMQALFDMRRSMEYAAETFNESHVFLWYAVAVCVDPAHHFDGDMIHVAKADVPPVVDERLLREVLCLGIDKHLSSRRYPWFDPAGIMGARHKYAQPVDDGAPETRVWFASMCERYDRLRADANAQGIEEAQLRAAGGRKRPAGDAGPPAKRRTAE